MFDFIKYPEAVIHCATQEEGEIIIGTSSIDDKTLFLEIYDDWRE